MPGLMEQVIAGMTAALAPIVEALEAGGPTADPAAEVGPGAPAEETMPGVDDLPLGEGAAMEEGGEDMMDEGAADEAMGLEDEEIGLDEEEAGEAYMADGDDDDDDDLEAYCDDGPAGKGGSPSGKKGGAMGYSAALAEANAKIAALQGRIDARERADRQTAAVVKSEQELSELGILTPTISKQLRTFAAQGPRALTAYMAAQREAAPHLPPTTWSGEQRMPASLAAAVSSDKGLATYAAQGPEAVRKARDLGAEYDQWQRNGNPPRVSRDQFISMNMGG